MLVGLVKKLDSTVGLNTGTAFSLVPLTKVIVSVRVKLALLLVPPSKIAWVCASVTPPLPARKSVAQSNTTELKRVYGIGSKLSARIVKTRNDLGGFHELNQVREVWGLDSIVVEELLKHATLRNPQLRRLNVNTTPFEQLRHPYLKFHMARALVAYRQQHGAFSAPDDLLKVKVIDSKTVEKLTPYLEF